MAKAKAAKMHDIGAPDEEHDWFVNSYVYPNGPGTYDHGEPYTVLLCPCGRRKTELMTDEESAEVRGFNQLPSERVVADDTEGGEEE